MSLAQHGGARSALLRAWECPGRKPLPSRSARFRPGLSRLWRSETSVSRSRADSVRSGCFERRRGAALRAAPRRHPPRDRALGRRCARRLRGGRAQLRARRAAAAARLPAALRRVLGHQRRRRALVLPGGPGRRSAGGRAHARRRVAEHVVRPRLPLRRRRRLELRQVAPGLRDRRLGRRAGRFTAVCVSATEIATGRTVTFVDHRDRDVPSWTNDVHHVARPATIGPEHALASAAIPLLFPTVRIGDTFYCDGSLRQQTPLSPALRLGSNRVLVVGLRHGRPPSLADPLAAERVEQMHTVGFLFGKVLDALLIDRLEYDLGQMRVVNRILRAGLELYGDEYLE